MHSNSLQSFKSCLRICSAANLTKTLFGFKTQLYPIIKAESHTQRRQRNLHSFNMPSTNYCLQTLQIGCTTVKCHGKRSNAFYEALRWDRNLYGTTRELGGLDILCLLVSFLNRKIQSNTRTLLNLWISCDNKSWISNQFI